MTDNWIIAKEIEIMSEKHYYVKVIAQIRHNETGEVRDYETEDLMTGDETVPHTYIWEEGNYSCDCNRRLFFLRAKGEEEPEEVPCGEDTFSVRLLNAKDKQEYYSDFK